MVQPLHKQLRIFMRSERITNKQIGLIWKMHPGQVSSILNGHQKMYADRFEMVLEYYNYSYVVFKNEPLN